MSGKRVISGDLSSIGLSDLFTVLNMSKKTGALRCTRSADTRTIYWEQGEIVFARSNSVLDSLGSFLERRGLITPEQNAESARKITPETRHGKVLVRLGYISTEQLWWAVKNQVLEIVFSLFGWTSGFFEFLEGEVESREKITLSLSTPKVVMEGIRRLDEWRRFTTRISDSSIVLAPAEGRPPGLDRAQGATSEERKILTLVDGKRTVEEICLRSGMGEFETYAALYEALQAGEISTR